MNTKKMKENRFIPTRVGNTSPACWSGGCVPVHPHACGEYLRRVEQLVELTGSSPRVWGIPVLRLYQSMSVRFIPTRVGNTARYAKRRRLLPVHPHACGEYKSVQGTHWQNFGSSPRVWGILQA